MNRIANFGKLAIIINSPKIVPATSQLIGTIVMVINTWFFEVLVETRDSHHVPLELNQILLTYQVNHKSMLQVLQVLQAGQNQLCVLYRIKTLCEMGTLNINKDSPFEKANIRRNTFVTLPSFLIIKNYASGRVDQQYCNALLSPIARCFHWYASFVAFRYYYHPTFSHLFPIIPKSKLPISVGVSGLLRNKTFIPFFRSDKCTPISSARRSHSHYQT